MVGIGSSSHPAVTLHHVHRPPCIPGGAFHRPGQDPGPLPEVVRALRELTQDRDLPDGLLRIPVEPEGGLQGRQGGLVHPQRPAQGGLPQSADHVPAAHHESRLGR